MKENSKIEVQIENCQGYVWSVQDVLRLDFNAHLIIEKKNGYLNF